MKKIAKLSSLMMAIALGGCTYSQDAIFPSLFGSDIQEQAAENHANAGIVLGTTNFEPVNVSEVSNTGTFVGQKVMTFRGELSQLQNSIRTNNAELQKIRNSIINNALEYHKTIAEIETKLQVGTTPGNPHMFEKLAKAENNIQVMNTNAAALNQLSGRISADTANTDYLVEAIRSAYSISGAVDEDHRQLRILENEAGQTSILMHSLLNEVNSDISRQQQYVKTANTNITNLSSAIRVGSFGVNNAPISRSPLLATSSDSSTYIEADVPAFVGGKPLFSVRFANKNVDYKDGLKKAVANALAKKKNVVFDIVAVNSLQSTSANEYASKIFQEVINLGVTADRINISSKIDTETDFPAVMIFVK